MHWQQSTKVMSICNTGNILIPIRKHPQVVISSVILVSVVLNRTHVNLVSDVSTTLVEVLMSCDDNFDTSLKSKSLTIDFSGLH